MKDDRAWMQLAIREARKGLGRTSPNPCVGAVVVKNNRLIATGFHAKAGTPHAEVHALRAAGAKARGATIYVTLEPCSHTGRTPPCTQAILAAGIKRVVVGMLDPNPLVAGGGCKTLGAHGVAVTQGVLAEECSSLNRPFIKHITTGLPWVIMKGGMSLDGRLALASGQCSWITNEQSRRQVHRLRDRVDAILIGSETALCDDPVLTTRLSGRNKGKDPLRVILDTALRLPVSAKMLQQGSSAPTWIFCGPDADAKRAEALARAGAIIKQVRLTDAGQLDLEAVLCELGRAQLTSVLVEGGSRVHGAFLRANLVDEVQIFVAPIFLGSDGVPLVDTLGLQQVADAPRFSPTKVRRFGNDVLIEGLIEK
ncbi:MAG: bifunctional diaminohydroxyphosphoribosylaminopyrimidine deaminase/5-amino-6-(5-phosphoribosylamino)uracil reductase RibD [Proteobacteria bacterium]|nr:bifunctional diaminohydroxyphosphoribosylaminopyrimidine deaminase/5-amino-6-(5-phosphoribosylamino)uracil reductase RibD [Pseudomonadota bacterium]MBU1546927.1 bifunctional diaminohydroxyphosphoribosylaminopyrimidine deaminase/5-amino-6-(5-phosphoribosylamino)uracil reductase RibD [Pseudomonadota bacterium]MBU2618244.1 bifunctional diaminohydroxyphosphoribosylaminopyrimidine deaminase/5-amino-6-(5-phosphoribosylamino)uracil reductase RibD [Pseudomonadota bacterium]